MKVLLYADDFPSTSQQTTTYIQYYSKQPEKLLVSPQKSSVTLFNLDRQGSNLHHPNNLNGQLVPLTTLHLQYTQLSPFTSNINKLNDLTTLTCPRFKKKKIPSYPYQNNSSTPPQTSPHLFDHPLSKENLTKFQTTKPSSQNNHWLPSNHCQTVDSHTRKRSSQYNPTSICSPLNNRKTLHSSHPKCSITDVAQL